MTSPYKGLRRLGSKMSNILQGGMTRLGGILGGGLERWRRRYWRPGPGLARFAAMTPLVIITGGSEGIGLAFAKEFARAGHDLLLVARHGDRLEAARRALSDAFGVDVHVLAADLGTRQGRDALEAWLRGAGAYPDILVNSAGIGLSGPFHEQAPEDIDRLIDLDVGAVTDLMRRFLPDMLVRGRGGMLNIASLGGFVPGPYQAAYYASKAYVIGLTRAVAHEVAGMGVRICVLAPGPVATRFHARMQATNAYYLSALGVMRPEAVAKAGYRGFYWGRPLIVPGLVHKLNCIALRVIPHAIMVPFIGWLLRRRGE